MKSSPVLCIVAIIAWVVTALASINMGLLPLGRSLFQMEFMMGTSHGVFNGIHYLVGLCGIISLVMLVMKWHTHAGCKKCKC